MVGTIEKQIEVEEYSQNKHIQKYLQQFNKAIDSDRFDETSEGKLLVKLGFVLFRKKIAEYLGMKTRSKTRNFIKLLSDNPDELALITINTIVGRVGRSKGMTMTSTAETIATKLMDLHYFNNLKNDNPKLHKYLGTEYKKASAKRKEELMKKKIKGLKKIDFQTNISDKKIAVQVGATLIELFILSGANIIREDMIKKNKKTTKVLYLTTEAQEVIIRATNKGVILKSSNMLPMIVEPLDWEGNESGGYYTHPLKFVKTKTKIGKKWINDNEMEPIYKIINKLQKKSYRVNKEMLSIIEEVFYNNIIDPNSPKSMPRCYGGIPSSEVYKPKDLIYTSPGFPEESLVGEEKAAALKEWGAWNKVRERQKIALDSESSRRLDFINAINVAKQMKDFEKLWFVIQLDYRGRVYYNNQFFNPQSKKYVKSMLEFSEGRYLTDSGLRWLMIHTANTFGLDKELLPVRVNWFKENIDNILLVANKPMENKKLWVNTDSPFEYIAACKSYRDHLNGKKVHLPAQLDATNSGIQFYSGLVLDGEGAKKVNVINKINLKGITLRADIYQDVADLVNKKLKDGVYPKSVIYTDSEKVQHDKWTWQEVDSLTGKITRSHTKKNTMTVAYSVTFGGMRDQNWDIMEEAKLNNKVFWEGDEWVVNKILTEMNEKSIYETIAGAKLGQDFLKGVASKLKDVAKWYSPLYNFPVLQPSFKEDYDDIKTPMGELRIKLSNDIDLNKRKQASSIAANFIHSLDSSLLMYCVDKATDDIGVIHDCFLVHPNDCEEVRHSYREGYVKIMKTNPLKVFQDGLDIDEKDKLRVPRLGTLDLNKVMDSEYILS